MLAILVSGLSMAVIGGQARSFSVEELPSVQIREVLSMALSRGGDFLAVANSFGIRVVRTSTGEVVREWEAHVADSEANLARYCQVNGIVFLNDDNRLVTAGADGRIIVWDVLSGESLRVIDEPWIYGLEHLRKRVPLMTLAVSPDEKLVAVAIGKSIQLWDLSTGVHAGELGRKYERESIASKQMSVFEVRATRADEVDELLLWHLPVHSAFYRSITFSPDRALIAAALEGDVSVWDLNARKVAFEVQGADNPHWLTNRQLAASTGARGIGIWDIDSRRRVGDSLTAGTPLSFFQDGALLATVYQNRVLLWDVRASQQLLSHKAGDLNIMMAACSNDRMTFAVRTTDNINARLWRFVDQSPSLD